MKIMTPEERFERIERNIEFLAASQAQHDARLAENSKLIAENSRLIAEHSKQIEEHSKQIAENSRQVAELAGLTLRIGRVVEEQERRTGDAFARFAEAQKDLAEALRHTEERFNALIDVVERYFSDGHH